MKKCRESKKGCLIYRRGLCPGIVCDDFKEYVRVVSDYSIGWAVAYVILGLLCLLLVFALLGGRG